MLLAFYKCYDWNRKKTKLVKLMLTKLVKLAKLVELMLERKINDMSEA